MGCPCQDVKIICTPTRQYVLDLHPSNVSMLPHVHEERLISRFAVAFSATTLNAISWVPDGAVKKVLVHATGILDSRKAFQWRKFFCSSVAELLAHKSSLDWTRRVYCDLLENGEIFHPSGPGPRFNTELEDKMRNSLILEAEHLATESTQLYL